MITPSSSLPPALSPDDQWDQAFAETQETLEELAAEQARALEDRLADGLEIESEDW